VVQGVGFRPFVYRLACQRGLTGWVRNESDAVRLEIAGPTDRVSDFLGSLQREAPPQARIDSVEIEELSATSSELTTERGFEIYAGPDSANPQPTIPADLATCHDCGKEIADPSQRRYRYPFTNCTNCGPRWSIIRQLPYDRLRTSMAEFPLCPACRREYDNPADRRFHAQPVACPACGPQLSLLDPRGHELSTGDTALRVAAAALSKGQIMALQGLGGFQLLADATDVHAVAQLRIRKHRPDRPFALMFPSLDAVRTDCLVSVEEARELLSPAAPILLVRRIAFRPLVPEETSSFASDLPSAIAANVAPGNPYLGVMLPYTPLHHLLTQAVARPLVCTSGNLSEEPIAIEIDDALRRLGGVGRKAGPAIADLLLVHNRPIVRPVDDSVARVMAGGLQVLRRARGFAPLPLKLNLSGPTILAVGGHLKNTVGLALRGPRPIAAVLSQHIGDLNNPLSLSVFQRAIDDLLEFFAVKPHAVACDLHPDYASTRYAEELAGRWQIPLFRVQHHHAHVAACMAEHGIDEPVLGLSWDGTGYGTDGTIWGGEALLCQGASVRRVAHLRNFSLPGGDNAARQPRRSALGVLFEIMGTPAMEHVRPWFSAGEQQTFASMLARSVNCPRTSSMGRLFDAVAALCGFEREVTFEGQAAMNLEFAADADFQESYSIPLRASGDGLIADWEPMLRQILAEHHENEPAARVSARFHNGLAQLAVELSRDVGCDNVVLTGGCFQNALLTQRVRERLLDAGFHVYMHQQVPPGDGGIALGQIYVAARQMQGSFDVPGNSR
jgi:hydrogenase maturation protein HypF